MTADPTLLYAAASGAPAPVAAVWRSLDGGTNCQQIQSLRATLCGWTFPIIAPDAAVPTRVYLSYYCAAGRNTSASLPVSEDSWTTPGRTILRPTLQARDPLRALFPLAVAFDPLGTHGLVLGVRDTRMGGSALVRTDDGGATWQTLLDEPDVPSGSPPPRPVTLAALAAELPALNRLFAGVGGVTGRGVLGSFVGGWISVAEERVRVLKHQRRCLLHKPIEFAALLAGQETLAVAARQFVHAGLNLRRQAPDDVLFLVWCQWS